VTEDTDSHSGLSGEFDSMVQRQDLELNSVSVSLDAE
jgi:hypothetical protein